MSVVYVNGHYVADNEAKVSVYERAFLFGDGVYEVVPVYGGQAHRFTDHIARLQRSAAAIGLQASIMESDCAAILAQLLAYNGLQTASFYLQLSRSGVVGRREHAFPDAVSVSWFAFVTAWPAGEQAPVDKGLSVITVEDIRWQRCDIKAITLLPNVMARQKAAEAGCDEALFVRQGEVIEGSSSNLFAVKSGVLLTAPESSRILSGITRKVILELAQAAGWSIELRSLSVQELLTCDEVWISSSLREIKPVVQVDGHRIGEGQPGPRWRQMMGLFRAAIAD